MNCIIIEDQLPAQRILKKYIQDIGTLTLKATFTNALEAIQFLQTEEIEFIFLDIHLPKLSGIDFLKTYKNPPQVILTTAFSDYALESYDLNVVDYLLKPFSFQRFVQAVHKVKTNPHTDTSTTLVKELFIKSGYEHIKVKIDEILYIKSDTDYTELILANRKILSTEPLRYWETYLNKHNFIRVHKSYLINTTKIEKVTRTQIHLHLEQIIPIGRAYKDTFQNSILNS
ncbi:LytR/AlgR family response regulator transcription factor [Wenyingzhuangia aestuarii]|uniref:LytR/AlgR family response regulator transcription factor n=1 Tax=Wenyingzhuangia aestuarii TaxID=1647582 RepID=UPI00143BE055|nr:LytTR family DNA-binding domain-containing protein [Wenyingzhuangia aestuarii]NJB82759.1 DNA-binding LytR/AlgR family response regulator [Wenyingzhuangia aestuarii]